jgi:hypothetical protein
MIPTSELIMYVAAFVLGAVFLGPPMRYWSTLWEDRLHRHRARCETCQCREAERAPTGTERRG